MDDEPQIFRFSPEKNLKLKEERGVSFEEIIAAIENDQLLDIIIHPNKEKYGHQKIYVVEINGYIYLTPFVENHSEIFLKTIIPSRKAQKKYLEKEDQ